MVYIDKSYADRSWKEYLRDTIYANWLRGMIHDIDCDLQRAPGVADCGVLWILEAYG